MNKLGFYTKNFGAPGVIEAIKTIKPPVLLTELDDFSVLEHIRNDWSPDTFIVGRFYFTHPEQGAMLADDPAKAGVRLAERCLTHNFSFGQRRGNNHRLFISAWMSLNEAVRGPASFPVDKSRWRDEDYQNWDKMEQQAACYDTLQAAFLDRLKQEQPDMEAVAFNFAAGNWIRGEDYLKYFPKTLESYTYLGFHEYGWPYMNPAEPGARSGCGFYRQVMGAIRQQYGDRHRVIITEAGLARMYAYQNGGDVGWLHPDSGVTEAGYKNSLRWYNQLLRDDPYVLGACLYQVGPGGDWVTFRHTGLDNEGRSLTLMAELQAMTQEPTPLTAEIAGVAGTAAPESDLPTALWTAGRPQIIPLDREAKLYRAAQEHNLGERLTPEYEVLYSDQNYAAQIYEGGLVYTPVGQEAEVEVLPPTRGDLARDIANVVWDHHITGFHGTRWEYWNQYIKNQLPDLAMRIFIDEVLLRNPDLGKDARVFKQNKVYLMPRRIDQTPAPVDRPAYTPDQAQLQPVVPAAPSSPDFVRVSGGRFYLKGRPSRFIGVNIRGLVHYGHDPNYFRYAPKEHQSQQLQKAVEMNARLVRIFLAHKDATPEQIEARLRETLALIKGNETFKNIYLLPVLTNLYCDVPFYTRGDEEFYTLKTAEGHTILNSTFFKEGYTKNYLPFVQHIVTAFKNETHIFAWEIGNELKAQYDDHTGAPELLVDFMLDVAKEIKRLDPNHLVTTGMISTRHAWMAGRQELRQKLYGSPYLDFITLHPYNGNEKPENEKDDDSDLVDPAKKPFINKPFIIEEAGFNVKLYSNRPEKTRQDMANWFGKGASCYMPWGFMATGNDNGDGDNEVGICSKDRNDFRELYELHKKSGQILLDGVDDLQQLSRRISSIDFTLSREVVELPWPLLADGFDFAVGRPDGLGYKVDAWLVDQAYYHQFNAWHTGEDWNSQAGGDSDLGAPVNAVATGRVVTSQSYPVWGNVILLEHRLPWGQTVWSQYAHLKDRLVQKGDVVRRGEQIGTIGKGEGDCYPAHLHFEIRIKEVPAGKWWGNTPADREKILQVYVQPTNFISANRPR